MSTTNEHISIGRHRSRIVTGWLTIAALLLMTVTSCQRQEYLAVSLSTTGLITHTVFTTMGTATQYVKVYNHYDDPLLLRSVTLEQGYNSRFRLNVDGDTSLVARNVEIAPHDSMFIFVHANINPNASTEPFLVTDHIVFDWGSGSQKLLLTAYGRNAVYHIPDHVAYDAQGNAYPYSVIDCQQWNHQLPHVVYGYAVVDEGCTLSLTAGDEIYFGDDGHLWVYNGGTLHAQGTFETPVLFTSVRHDSYYDYLAGQWGYIWLSAGSKDNTMDWVVIENSFVGIVADTNVGNNPTLQITNSRIENCSYAGIIGQGATIDGDNLLVADMSPLPCNSVAAIPSVTPPLPTTGATAATTAALPAWYSTTTILLVTVALCFATYNKRCSATASSTEAIPPATPKAKYCSTSTRLPQPTSVSTTA